MWSTGGYSSAQGTTPPRGLAYAPASQPPPQQQQAPPPSHRVEDEDVVCLFEGRVPVSVHEDGKEQVQEELLVGVMAGGTFPTLEDARTAPLSSVPSVAAAAAAAAAAPGPLRPSDTTTMRRQVHLRLTSPTNPFLLYTSTIFEEDYHSFRERNELRFDFVQFPVVLVNLLQERTSEALATSEGGGGGGLTRSCRLQLGVSSPANPSAPPANRFSFCQSDKYCHSEVVGLGLTKEGDCGQKRHLAAQVRRLARELSTSEAACAALRAEHAAAAEAGEARVSALTQEGDALERELAARTAALRAEAEARESAQESRHAERLAAAQEKADERVAAAAERLTREETQHAARAREADELQRRSAELAARVSELEARAQQAEAEGARRAEAVARLEEERAELEKTVAAQHKQLHKQELRLVEADERLRATEGFLAAERRAAAETQGALDAKREEATTWCGQAAALQKQAEEKDAEFKKSQHVIRSMMEKLRRSKELREGLQREAAERSERLSDADSKARGLDGELRAARLCADEQERRADRLEEETKRLQKELSEANSCIEYHNRSTRYTGGAYSALVGGGSSGTGAAAASAKPAAAYAAATYTSAATAVAPAAAVSAAASADLRVSGLAGVGGAEPAAAAASSAALLAEASTLGSERAGSAATRSPLSADATSPLPLSKYARAVPVPSTAAAAAAHLPTHRSTLLTSSPACTPGLVKSLARAAAHTGTRAGAGATAPSNFFVAEVTGPVGTTA